MLTEFLWIVAFLLPKAVRERDRFGLTAAVVAALLSLIGFC
jgi:hypothetical protein